MIIRQIAMMDDEKADSNLDANGNDANENHNNS